jgi:putative membrane protein
VASAVASAVLATAVLADGALAGGVPAGGARGGELDGGPAGGVRAGGVLAGAPSVREPAPAVPPGPPPGPAVPPGWAAELLTGDLVAHGRAARRRRYVRAVGGAGLLAAAALGAWAAGLVPAWTGLGPLVLLPLGAALAADRYASLGHRLAGGWLVTRTGSLIRRRSVLSTEGIIGWRIHQSWFQRRQGLATLAATTAAGRQHYAARDIPVAMALDLATEATTELLRPFRTPA